MGDKKFFIASFNRASDGALQKLKELLMGKGTYDDFLSENPPEGADYIIAPGDREETFEFCRAWYGKKPIIHLWAGEASQGMHDEIYRWAITNMSMMQLCTTEDALERVARFCQATGKELNGHVVGNVMLDSIPEMGYDLILYNPPTVLSDEQIQLELDNINDMLKRSGQQTYFWLAPNGDSKSDLVKPFVNTPNLERNQFLNLLKNCTRFISNSSCIDYEAKHIISDDKIVRVGLRNKDRSSITEDMSVTNATENILRVLETLE